MTHWDPAQYLKFSQPRLQPALDLLARIPSDPVHALVDLGCGTGHITQILQKRWPDAEVTGVDNSASMLAKAKVDAPGIRWLADDLGTWQSTAPLDLIFSNAALHWVPQHETFFPRLLRQVKPAGWLAIQMPRNFDAPSHVLMEATVRSGVWKEMLEPLLRPVPVAPPDFYYRMLEPLTQSLSVWETVYLHALEGPDPVKEWVKSTWLSPLLAALPAEMQLEFEQAYAARLRQAYPSLPSGVTLFPFRRLFLLAQTR